MRRKVNMGNEEPKQFEMPSEVEHLFRVMSAEDDSDIVSVKLEVISGDEEGRTMLHRVNLDNTWKGFFLTRLFLKAIAEEYKGEGVVIDSDNWLGREFSATVIHNKGKNGKMYANIDKYNFLDAVSQEDSKPEGNSEDGPWNE